MMFSKNSFRCSEFTYGVTKDQNVESLLCQKTFRRSEFTYGVTKDQNVESAIFDVLIVVVVINSKHIFDVLMSTFWSTKKTISTFWNFWPVDVLIVDVPTPCHFYSQCITFEKEVIKYPFYTYDSNILDVIKNVLKCIEQSKFEQKKK
jgi:hypothetical protein